MENYLAINKALWNKKTPFHLSSAFYDMEAFKAGKSSLTAIELPLLGNVKGKEILHLQCHFGQDTLSLARMGATVTGLDFSPTAIEAARNLAQELGLPATFIEGNVLEVEHYISHKYDLIFSTYGVVGWHPDLQLWARNVVACLRQGGELVFAEFHPVMWMLDNDFKHIQYSYFNKEAICDEEPGTYANKEADMNLQAITWNHALSDVIGALLLHGMRLVHFSEYDYSPYNVFPNGVKIGDNQYQIAGYEAKLPLVYALKMVKE
ncbi:MAG: class I SAM-dependent methyltransferase [Chitinophagia bacterium]|nr:class I SAM-dependent methyltransferase [Chitinophagia bacterium]